MLPSMGWQRVGHDVLTPVTGDKYTVKIPRVNGYSTKSTLPDQIYIDLDIGEAFYYFEVLISSTFLLIATVSVFVRKG